MGLDAQGKAYTRTKTVDWSPADGDFVGYCPTNAIVARKIERIVPLQARRARRGVARVIRAALASDDSLRISSTSMIRAPSQM